MTSRPGAARALFSAALKSLHSAGVPDARASALYLLAHAHGSPSASVGESLLLRNAALPAPTAAAFASFIARRCTREPLQYIVGAWDFSILRNVAVSAPVLIPRPETEELVALALQFARAFRAPTSAPPVLIDAGTGSGVILAAALAQLPAWRGFGVDVSRDAVALARENVARAGVDARARVDVADVGAWVNPSHAASLVVANPPYICAGDVRGLEPEVRRFEDVRALDGGRDGLSVPLAFIRAAARWTHRGAHLLLEVGTAHPRALANAMGCSVSSIASASGFGGPTPLPVDVSGPVIGAADAAALTAHWRFVRALTDFAGRPRFVELERR
jgi:release factor glutamine methyltransferase